MEELLTPRGTTYTTTNHTSPVLQEIPATRQSAGRPGANFEANSPAAALEALKTQPDYETLVAVLRYLVADKGPWSLQRPGSEASQIVNCLVTEIAPNYWTVLKEGSAIVGHGKTKQKGSSDVAVFLRCLRSPTGVNAILRTLERQTSHAKNRVDVSLDMVGSLELLCAVLDGEDCVSTMWEGITDQLDDKVKRRILAQELSALIGGGKIIARSAEAHTAMEKPSTLSGREFYWISDGKEYSQWLARNITAWIGKRPGDEAANLCSTLLTKALRLGYTDTIIEHLFDKILLNSEMNSLLDGLPQSEQRRVLHGTLKLFSDRYLDVLGRCESNKAVLVIAAAAGVVARIVGTDETRRSHLVSWLVSSSGAGMGEAIGIRRAALAVFSRDRDSIVTILEKSLSQFGDQLYIKHSPLLQQEAHAQVLLLSAAYVHRINPIKLKLLLRSSVWLNAISNRLAASQARARLLGMIVGEALSGLLDSNEKKLDFHHEETESEEGKWYKGLVQVHDSIGSDPSLLLPRAAAERDPTRRKIQATATSSKPAAALVAPPRSRTLVIEEVKDKGKSESASESDDDDLPVYGKPDSDAEDSDEDATLVRRDKPKAPVYIRDLIRFLRDTENYDHQKLGLATAPTLIRRKANYGTEVKDHVEELASILVGLQDKFDMDDFADLRLQGMIATVVAQPQKMGQWFAKTFFDGDYSISQRASVLVVLGLGARELAGLETSRFAAAASFGSKTLPAKVEKLFLQDQSGGGGQSPSSAAPHLKALPPNALERVAKAVTSDFLAPIAATAADSATGPDALKLSTYSSRLERASSGGLATSARAKAGKSGPAVRVIPNTTAQLLSTSFFFPLTARFQAATHSAVSRTRGILFQPYLLALFLKTAAVILHAAGPSTLALPQMTAELWSLLLSSSIRAHSVGDLALTQAVLFAVLALLDANENRMRDLCRDNAREVVQTQEWVAQVFEATRGEDGGEENEVKMLAAGILIRLRDGMEKYRMLLVGDMIDVG